VIDFFEFIARRRKPTLPNPATMLAKLGITHDVPHEIDVQMLVKHMKKTATVTPGGPTVEGSEDGQGPDRPPARCLSQSDR
jgi:hypothetical protein